MDAVGLGRLGPSASLPGDPGDDRGWSFTGWYDTTEAQALLDFQEHDWSQTLAWIAETQGRMRTVVRLLSPILRPVLRTVLQVQRRLEGRGPYADPWALIEKNWHGGARRRHWHQHGADRSGRSIPSALRRGDPPWAG